jgi:NAD(P)-dependent dehydrogenase (short-subunit alcohol dehydrogenase family)
VGDGIIDKYGERAGLRKAPGSFDLSGEIAVVTGSTGRLGKLWIKALRDAGATVWGTDTEASMNGSPFKGIQAGHADITNEKQVRALFALVKATSGHAPTILVNNAGVDSRPSMTDYDAMAADMARVNLLGTDLMTRVFGTAMAEAGKGSIINIASLYGLVVPDLRYYDHRDDGWVKDPMYGATKAGVIQLTRYYAAKWGTSGVRVNALAPGGVVAGSGEGVGHLRGHRRVLRRPPGALHRRRVWRGRARARARQRRGAGHPVGAPIRSLHV